MKIPDDIKLYVRKRIFLRIALWVLCMVLFSFAFFSSWNSILDSDYTDIRVVIFLVILVVSVFAFGIPKILFGKSFVGKIVALNVVHKNDNDMRMGLIESLYRRIWVYATIELENGKKIRKDITSKSTRGLHIPPKHRKSGADSYFSNQYCVGDTVIFISGTKYCQVYSEEKENLTCVVCGEFSKRENKRCEHCGHTILKG